MKKSITRLLCGAMSLLTLCGVTACGGKENKYGNRQEINATIYFGEFGYDAG